MLTESRGNHGSAAGAGSHIATSPRVVSSDRDLQPPPQLLRCGGLLAQALCEATRKCGFPHFRHPYNCQMPFS